MEEKRFYVYIHYNKQTGEPFYIGKGQKNRLNHTLQRSQYWKNYVKKYGFESDYLEENLFEDEALFLERYWINQFITWGFKLVNFTQGGEVNPKYWLGKKRPDISIVMKNKIYTDEIRKNMAKPHLGKHYSIETEFKKGFIPKNKGISKYEFKLNNKPAEKCLCKFCNNEFIKRKDKNTLYCSRQCSGLDKRKK